MNPSRFKRISKFLSLVLRHEPDKINLQLDPQGWADVDELLSQINLKAFSLDRQTLERVVSENDKQRFAFSSDKTKIRASQGHTIEIELDYTPAEPPEMLYHGTTSAVLAQIKKDGLQKRKRHHVHLSQNRDTALAVGKRHGPPAILTIQAGSMHEAGHKFYRSANGVWLTDSVPSEFILFP